jgi:PAS domain S-box-containing protein
MKNEIVETDSFAAEDRLYQKMVEEIQDYAIILLDRQGLIRNWNKGAEKIKQYSQEEVLGRHFSIFYLPEDLASNLPQKLIDKGRWKAGPRRRVGGSEKMDPGSGVASRLRHYMMMTTM